MDPLARTQPTRPHGYRPRALPIFGQAGNATGVEWCRPPCKACLREIEASPKQLHRSDLANKPRAEPMEDAADRDQGLEETLDRLGIIGPRVVVFAKNGTGSGNSLGRPSESCVAAEPSYGSGRTKRP